MAAPCLVVRFLLPRATAEPRWSSASALRTASGFSARAASRASKCLWVRSVSVLRTASETAVRCSALRLVTCTSKSDVPIRVRISGDSFPAKLDSG